MARWNTNTKIDLLWSGSVFFLSVLLLIFLGFSLTSKVVTNETFYTVYIALGVIGCVYSIGAIFFWFFDRVHDTAAEKAIASSFFLSDASKQRPLSRHIVLRVGAVSLFILLVVLSVFAAGSLFGVPNPYGAEPLSHSALAQHSVWANVWNTSVYPGLYEELPVHAAVSIMVFVISWTIALLLRKPALRYNLFVFLFAVLVSVSLGAGMFTVAHREAYGLDEKAFVTAYTFEWMAQLLNQTTGLFVSWIPHMIHNALVVANTQFSIVGGGATQ